MRYFYVRELENGFEQLYQSEIEVEVNDFVVIEDYENNPITAKVVKLVSKYHALTSQRSPNEIIDVVDMKSWNEKRERELEKSILIDRMETQIKEITLLEKLEKFAGKDPKMLELFNEFTGQTSTHSVGGDE